MRYDVLAKDGALAEPEFIRSVTSRAHAIELADDLVERDGRWSAHVATERRLVTYSRHREPVVCAVRGWELPLHKGRGYLVVRKGQDERMFALRTDDESAVVRKRFVDQGYAVLWEMSVRECDEAIHAEVVNLFDEWRNVKPPF